MCAVLNEWLGAFHPLIDGNDTAANVSLLSSDWVAMSCTGVS
jgi:hypothetical protein